MSVTCQVDGVKNDNALPVTLTVFPVILTDVLFLVRNSNAHLLMCVSAHAHLLGMHVEVTSL